MTTNITERLCTHEAALLLPWYVTNTLTDTETALVKTHLEVCDICRQELQHEQQLHTRLVTEYNAIDPSTDQHTDDAQQINLQPLLTKIASTQHAATLPAHLDVAVKTTTTATQSLKQWLLALIVIQVLGFSITMLWQQQNHAPTTGYTTLSNPSTQQHNAVLIRAVFTPTTTLDELHTILRTAHVTLIADAPTTGLYTLAVNSTDTAAVQNSLNILHAQPQVLFAEPMAISAPPQLPPHK